MGDLGKIDVSSVSLTYSTACTEERCSDSLSLRTNFCDVFIMLLCPTLLLLSLILSMASLVGSDVDKPKTFSILCIKVSSEVARMTREARRKSFF